MDQHQAPPRDVPVGGERRLNGSAAADGDHVGYRLRLAHQRASADLTQAIGAHGITPMQFQTLLRLHQRGPMTQNELGRSVGMPPANIHSTVRRLISAGLVTTEPPEGNRRRTMVRLTTHGERTLRDVLPIADAANARTLSVLTEAEEALIMELLRRLAQ
jgi:MarR family transcriptional regulator, lower aerobic nicotinate degradation pathway regulator